MYSTSNSFLGAGNSSRPGPQQYGQSNFPNPQQQPGGFQQQPTGFAGGSLQPQFTGYPGQGQQQGYQVQQQQPQFTGFPQGQQQPPQQPQFQAGQPPQHQASQKTGQTSSQIAASFQPAPPAQPQRSGHHKQSPSSKIPKIRLSFLTATDQAKFEQLFKSAVGDGQALDGERYSGWKGISILMFFRGKGQGTPYPLKTSRERLGTDMVRLLELS